MQALYLIRHGEPAFENGKICLGKLNLELSEKGKAQAASLKEALRLITDKRTASSPLIRCIMTAKNAGAEEPEVREGFSEIDMGVWDGLPFQTIREKWPKEFAMRGENIEAVAPPNGETLPECRARVFAELKAFSKENPTGNLVVFTHNAAAKMLVSGMYGIEIKDVFYKEYPYCGCVQMLIDGEKSLFEPVFTELKAIPTPEECLSILEDAKTPDKVVDHCKAVADKAVDIAKKLNESGFDIDIPTVRAASLLHDIDRTTSRHELAGAKRLLEMGYASLASIVGDHMELPSEEEERISEKSVVFVADKLIKHTGQVSLYQRYLGEVLEKNRPYAESKFAKAKKTFALFERYVSDIGNIY